MGKGEREEEEEREGDSTATPTRESLRGPIDIVQTWDEYMEKELLVGENYQLESYNFEEVLFKRIRENLLTIYSERVLSSYESTIDIDKDSKDKDEPTSPVPLDNDNSVIMTSTENENDISVSQEAYPITLEETNSQQERDEESEEVEATGYCICSIGQNNITSSDKLNMT